MTLQAYISLTVVVKWLSELGKKQKNRCNILLCPNFLSTACVD